MDKFGTELCHDVNQLSYRYIKCNDPVYQDVLELRYNEFFKKYKLPRDIVIDSDEESAYHLVCMMGDRLVGYMRLVVSGEMGHLSQFVVVKEYRHYGIGTKLIRMNEQKAYKLGVKEMELSAKVELLEFYYNLGYSNVGEIFPSKKTGLPHRVVKKKLEKEQYGLGMNKNKIKVAIIGTGFGAIVHLPAFIHSEHYQVTGIYGRNYDKTVKIANQYAIKAYRTLDEIEEDTAVDMVSISSIVSNHFEIAERFMKIKKNILLEKPMAMDRKQTEALANMAQQYGVNTAIGYEHIYDSSWQFLRQIVRENRYGTIRSIQFDYSFTYWNEEESTRKYDWFSQKEYGGGLRGGHFSHILRIVDFISDGQIESLSGRGFVEVPSHYDSMGQLRTQTAEDTVVATIIFGKGIPAYVNISAARNETFKKVLINTEKAQIVINGQKDLKIYNWKNELLVDHIEEQYVITDYQDDFRINSFVKLLDDFYQLYYAEKKESDIVDFAKGHELQKLLDQIT